LRAKRFRAISDTTAAIAETVPNMMWRNKAILMAMCLALSSGCFCHGICTKRASEERCPTDIRKTHYWCFGEDAIMHCPCGPKEERYGYERTDWREWPSECGDEIVDVVPVTKIHQPERLPPQTNRQAPTSAATDPFANELPAPPPARPSPAKPAVTMPPAVIVPQTQHPGLIEPSEPTGRTNPGVIVSPQNPMPRSTPPEPIINGPLQKMQPNRPVTAPELPPKRTNQNQIQRPLLEEELSPEERDRRRQALSRILPISE